MGWDGAFFGCGLFRIQICSDRDGRGRPPGIGEVHVPAAIGMELEVAMDLVVAAMGEVRRESVRVLYLYILTQSRRVGT